MKDMKESLTSTRKPDITHVRSCMMTYIARTCEYGSAKGYERANYQRSAGETMRDNFLRFRAYQRASLSHKLKILDAMEAHQANDPKLEDVEGMKRAVYCADTDAPPWAEFPASGLPHICGDMASNMMALQQAVDCGLLPEDPGTPWAVTPNQDFIASGPDLEKGRVAAATAYAQRVVDAACAVVTGESNHEQFEMQGILSWQPDFAPMGGGER